MTSDSPVDACIALGLLSLCELFPDLDPSSFPKLWSEVDIIRLEGGQVLMRQGDLAECMFAVVSGRLHMFVDAEDGESYLIGEVRAGETVGELDLVDGQCRMATVRAVRDSELVRVSRRAFEKLVRENPDSLNKLAQVLARRMRSVAQRQSVSTTLKTIAVVAAGAGSHEWLPDFTARVCAVLGTYGPVLHLSSNRFEQLFRTPFDPDRGMSTWLGELEGVYRFIVCEADSVPSPWTMHCIRQSDRILGIGLAGSPPEPSGIERAIDDERKRRSLGPMELVLLHEEAGRVFAGTQAWLATREVFRHDHVRLHVAGDMERLARILAGKAVGLALGGGGARGFAHIGIIRAIEEAGIPIDMIGGVSMGSIIAGQFAMGCDWQTMLRINKAEMARSRLNVDFTIPIVSLSSGRKLRRALKSFFGHTAIEDLWLNYFCTSCNLSTNEIVVHRTGPLWNCVNASNAIPVLLPPVLAGGHILVDGGILNNQPGDILKDICGGSVIVSSVSPRKDISVHAARTEMPSPWKILRSRVNPFETTIMVPGISSTMMRTLMCASDKKSREVERTADFYLRPPIDQFRLDDFSRIEEIVDIGYRYARDEIQRWKADNRI